MTGLEDISLYKDNREEKIFAAAGKGNASHLFVKQVKPSQSE
ncbi:hypothetical protein [Parendozoicomonas sp. Alg238-R29]|nr:hypothetical protein [Parendozoicomonas sp. Alg238-R29]